jgi:NAD(P)-dependent dehydrogenase (short-subunit alcohol dehydrogenase family)
MLCAGKVALVTGGASGIGRAAALIFAREGAQVAIADVDRDGGEAAAADIEEAGGEALFIGADVTREENVATMVARTVERFGGLDIALNNAGGPGRYASVTDVTAEDWANVLALNMTAIWLCMKYEIPELEKRGGGAIVNTASRNGDSAAPNLFAYTAAKHGVIGMSRSAALDLARRNIRVNALQPGFTMTPMVEMALRGSGMIAAGNIEARVPMGRWGRPEEPAEAAVWLCSERASYVTGTTLVVDGGVSAVL